MKTTSRRALYVSAAFLALAMLLSPAVEARKVTWSRTPAQTRPHLVAGFDLRTTRTIEPTAADPTSRQVLGLSLGTSAGGIGHTWEDGRGEGTPVLGYSVATSAPVEGGWLPAGVVEGAGPEVLAGGDGPHAAANLETGRNDEALRF